MCDDWQVGMALGVLSWLDRQLEELDIAQPAAQPTLNKRAPLKSWRSIADAVAEVKACMDELHRRRPGHANNTPSVIVIGALGRCGQLSRCSDYALKLAP